jgi:hypothetical protein
MLRQPAKTPNAPSTPAAPIHASAVTQETAAPLVDTPHHSGPPSPSAAPAPMYANTHSTHFGASASNAAGSNQRSARVRRRPAGEDSTRGDDIGGLVVTVVMAHPIHARVHGIFVAALRHEIENRVGPHELLHAAPIS